MNVLRRPRDEGLRCSNWSKVTRRSSGGNNLRTTKSHIPSPRQRALCTHRIPHHGATRTPKVGGESELDSRLSPYRTGSPDKSSTRRSRASSPSYRGRSGKDVRIPEEVREKEETMTSRGKSPHPDQCREAQGDGFRRMRRI